MWWMNRNIGGYLIIRKSDHGWWPHFLWSNDLYSFWAYVPLKRLVKCDKWKIPPVIFKGRVIYNAL